VRGSLGGFQRLRRAQRRGGLPSEDDAQREGHDCSGVQLAGDVLGRTRRRRTVGVVGRRVAGAHAAGGGGGGLTQL
jgi:hypothetical protein